MSATDPFGNPVALGGPASEAGIEAFAAGFLACEARVVDLLRTAEHDDAPIVQACAAALQMFAEAPGAPDAARRHLARADGSKVAASERERRFAAAVRAWVEGDAERALTLHEEQARRWPRDLVSVKLGQYHAFNLGDAPRMLRLALTAAPAAADVAAMHGMLAFGYEQCHLLPAAEAAARRAVAMCRREPWAHHALAHVMLTDGRFAEGTAFLDDVADTWTGLNSFMVSHNWWHAALFRIELGRLDEALDLYDRRVWGVAPDYSQDQVNAVSLLARLELAGADVGGRWAPLAERLAGRVHDHVLPFLDMHYLYGLARANRPEAELLTASLAAYVARVPVGRRAAWRDVCLPACRGLAAYARGDAQGALDGLGVALPRLVEIGGSHAQRDLFEQMRVAALLASGRHAAAWHLLQPQAAAQPASRRLQALLARIAPEAGLDGGAGNLTGFQGG